MTVVRNPLFPNTPPVRSDLRTPYLNSYGPKNPPLKALPVNSLEAEHATRRVMHWWYWEQPPAERYRIECERALADGQPKPPMPPELAKTRKGKANETD